VSCAKNGRTDRDAVWDTKLGGSREDVSHENIDAATGRALSGCLAD